MTINDIQPKSDSPYVLEIIRRLGIEPLFYLTAEEINTIVEAVKNMKPGDDVSLNGFVKELKYNEENHTLQFQLEGEDIDRVVTLIPKEITDKISSLEEIVQPLRFYSDTYTVEKTHIENERVKVSLTELPLPNSLLLFVRGVFIDNNAYVINGKEVTIYNNRLEYKIQEDDFLSIRYNY